MSPACRLHIERCDPAAGPLLTYGVSWERDGSRAHALCDETECVDRAEQIAKLAGVCSGGDVSSAQSLECDGQAGINVVEIARAR